MSPSPTVIHVDAGGISVLFVVLFAFVAAIGVASLVVWIWALVDAIQVPDDTMYRSGTKLVWVLVIVFLHIVGAILYFAVGRPRKGTITEVVRPGSGAMPPPPT